MTKEERIEIFKNFLRNGMDVSPFGFVEDYDKENFFTMVKEYTTAMTTKQVDIRFDFNKDIIIFIDDRFICNFFIDASYTTLRVDTDLSTDDEDLILCLTMLFMTIKELSTMIKTLSEAFDRTAQKSKRGNKYTKSNSKKNFVPTSNLPKNILNNIEKIKELQKSILSENEKYRTTRKKKDD